MNPLPYIRDRLVQILPTPADVIGFPFRRRGEVAQGTGLS
jgi:hypothetical protein